MNEETVATDDAVIGRAVRRSIIAITLVGIAIGLIYGVGGKLHKNLPHQPPLLRIEPFAIPTFNPPTALFTDITASAGIHFTHHSQARGEKLLPEVMGGGVAFFDYDNDGLPDLLLVDSASVSLYHNDGHGHFSDVTASSGLSIPFYGMGVAVGDYDNDGWVDILITGVGGCRLFHNDGHGRFHDVTIDAGVGGSADDWSTAAAFVDYDNDGKLDLFICNYIKWSREIDLKMNNTSTGVGRTIGPPANFEGAFSRLYHNDGNGHFSDVSKATGIQVRNKDTGVPVGKALGVAPIDMDGDGLIDFVIANDTVQNFLFHNKRGGAFEEIGMQSGIAFDTNGQTRSSMGIDAAHFHNDDCLGIAIGTLSQQTMGFYAGHARPQLPPLFTDDAIIQNLGSSSVRPMKFGVLFFDYDLDGWLDLLCVNGHIEPEISKVMPGETYAQPAQLYWNAGARGGPFVLTTPRYVGDALVRPIVGRGCAYADIDGDGDLDLILTQIDGPPLLLRNDQHAGHHYLRLKLVGKTCNRDAIGASVIVRVGGHTLRRDVMPTRGYLSQSELPITFGLGDHAKPDSIEIHWPGGGLQRVTDYRIDAVTRVEQSENAK